MTGIKGLYHDSINPKPMSAPPMTNEQLEEIADVLEKARAKGFSSQSLVVRDNCIRQLLDTDIPALLEEVKRLKEYANHKRDCLYWAGAHNCTCGWDAALGGAKSEPHVKYPQGTPDGAIRGFEPK